MRDVMYERPLSRKGTFRSPNSSLQIFPLLPQRGRNFFPYPERVCHGMRNFHLLLLRRCLRPKCKNWGNLAGSERSGNGREIDRKLKRKWSANSFRQTFFTRGHSILSYPYRASHGNNVAEYRNLPTPILEPTIFSSKIDRKWTLGLCWNARNSVPPIQSGSPPYLPPPIVGPPLCVT